MRASTAYYLYDATADFGIAMTVTVYAPFLLSIGLSLAEIALVNSVFWFTIVLMELPTGMLADGKSRVWSLKMGSICLTFGGIAYLCAQGFWSAMFAEILIGVSMSFFSGAEQAWITDALHREGRDHERRKVFATGALIRAGVMLFGGLIGSLIALYNPRLIWAPMIITSPFTWLIIHRYMNGKGEPIHKMTEVEALRASVSMLRGSRALVWLIATIIVFGAVVAFNNFWSPFFIPKVGTLGLSWVWALMYGGMSCAAIMIHRLTLPHGHESSWILGALVLTGMGLFIAGYAGGLMIPLSSVVVHEIGRGMFQPLVDSFVQHRIESGYRATFVSLQSLLGRIGLVITPLVIWFTIRDKPNTSETISNVWIICGTVLVTGALVLACFRTRPEVVTN